MLQHVIMAKQAHPVHVPLAQRLREASQSIIAVDLDPAALP
jgi:hypothetical protein